MVLKQLILDFISVINTSSQVEIYNKAGLRHTLVSFLEGELDDNTYGIQVEREPKSVVLGAVNENFPEGSLDIYIFELSGKGQFCVQVLVGDIQDSFSRTAVLAQVSFLKGLAANGFKENGLLFAYQLRSLSAEEEFISEMNEVLPDYAIEWRELLPVSKDVNGPWMCFYLEQNATA